MPFYLSSEKARKARVARIFKRPFYPPTPAMPDDCKIQNNSLASYHKYYIEHKKHFAKWTKRDVPLWFTEGLNTHNANL